MPIGKWDKDCGGQGHKTPYEAVRYTGFVPTCISLPKSQEKKFYKNDIYDSITVFRREINDIIDINNLKRIPLLNILKYMAPTVGRIVYDISFDELIDILKGNKKQHQ